MIGIDKLQYKYWKCNGYLKKYVNGGYAIQLYDVADGSPVATLTRWLPGLEIDEIAIDINNCGNEAVFTLLSNHIIAEGELRKIQSGYVSYPVYKLHNDVLAKIKEKTY